MTRSVLAGNVLPVFEGLARMTDSVIEDGRYASSSLTWHHASCFSAVLTFDSKFFANDFLRGILTSTLS
jgi:hypothetical protein